MDAMPPGGGESFLLWAIGTLVVTVGSLFALYLRTTKELKAAHELRIADRDRTIAELRKDLDDERAEKMRLMGEIKPSLDAAATVMGSIAQMLNK